MRIGRVIADAIRRLGKRYEEKGGGTELATPVNADGMYYGEDFGGPEAKEIYEANVVEFAKEFEKRNAEIRVHEGEAAGLTCTYAREWFTPSEVVHWAMTRGYDAQNRS